MTAARAGRGTDGRVPGQGIRGVSGAPGAELALFRLGQVTGQGQATPQQYADNGRRYY